MNSETADVGDGQEPVLLPVAAAAAAAAALVAPAVVRHRRRPGASAETLDPPRRSHTASIASELREAPPGIGRWRARSVSTRRTYLIKTRTRGGEEGREGGRSWPQREEERWGMGIGRWRRGGAPGGCDGGTRGIRAVHRLYIGTRREWALALGPWSSSCQWTSSATHQFEI